MREVKQGFLSPIALLRKRWFKVHTIAHSSSSSSEFGSRRDCHNRVPSLGAYCKRRWLETKQSHLKQKLAQASDLLWILWISKRTMSFVLMELPQPLINNICSHLDYKSLVRLSEVNFIVFVLHAISIFPFTQKNTFGILPITLDCFYMSVAGQ